MGAVKNAHRHLVAIPPRKEQCERLGTVLKSDLNVLNGFIELRRGQMTDLWEHGNDFLGCIRSKKFLLPPEQS
jgi:hypothetical protein